ncbi:sialin [Episyrphus balteatus]|uniref:sialin n=1 Tax=Episyrphus balteatus TaxID=286459 RepID=UPI0024862BB1|nr:sialin [Episyrphus balteatus]XP_055857856.1 sialin [Episyrphus balteatus]XP_055857857.1 sialin [Episyrphus balteatus]XP_055857858.1 sialin [Episyrphus balteatus]
MYSPEDGLIHQRKTNFCYALGAKVPSRMVLYFLSWSGFLVSFMMRNDINFALVAMVRANDTSTTTTTIPNDVTTQSSFKNFTDQMYLQNNFSNLNNNSNFDDSESNTNSLMFLNENNNYNNNINFNNILNTTSTNNSRSVKNFTNIDGFDGKFKNKKNVTYHQYDWDSTTKGAILGSFYWCYVLSQVAGGIATQYFGTKKVFGWSQFATGCCSFLIPYAADFHYIAVVILRSIQGFASGLTWPAMYALVGFWIPLAERSRFMSSFQGFSIGIGLTYPLCGFIIDHFGWPYVFYTTGSLAMLWCIMWYLLAFNSPKEHPRISPSELEYIEVNVSREVKESQGMRVPWKSIFTSLPVWAIGITTFGRIWVHYQFILSGPIFMKQILGLRYQSNGLLSGLPFLCSYISSVFFCYAADKLVCKQIMSLTNVRKLFTAASQIIPGVLLLFIGYIDNIILVLVVWFIAVTFVTASYAGAMASIVDIAPNLAGPVLAFAQTIHMSASFLSPVITGLIVVNERSIDEWRQVFWVSCIIAICTYSMFQIYGTADVQSWNRMRKKNASSEEESDKLKKTESGSKDSE